MKIELKHKGYIEVIVSGLIVVEAYNFKDGEEMLFGASIGWLKKWGIDEFMKDISLHRPEMGNRSDLIHIAKAVKEIMDTYELRR